MKIIRRIFCHGKNCGNFELVRIYGNYRWFRIDSEEKAEIIHKTLKDTVYKYDNMYEAFRFNEGDLQPILLLKYTMSSTEICDIYPTDLTLPEAANGHS